MIRRAWATLVYTLLLSCAAQNPRILVNPDPDQTAQLDFPVSSTARKKWTDLCALRHEGRVRAIGRYSPCSSGPLRSAWSGTGLSVRFTGTELRLSYQGPRLRYALIVDGIVRDDFYFEEGEQTRSLYLDAQAREHSLEIIRQGEALFGIGAFTQLEIVGGTLLSPRTHPERSIEIYGDSITCGYGNEGKGVDCGFSAETENHLLSYGQILAGNLGAELTTIAWSGKGVASNYAGEATPTLVQIAELAAPPEETRWIYPKESSPQAVIVNLGTNDYSTEHDPSPERFKLEYRRLLEQIRSHHSSAFILATVGPLLTGNDLRVARKNIEDVVNALKDSGDSRIESYELAATNEDPGCDYHPGLSTHRKMAAELEEELRRHLGW